MKSALLSREPPIPDLLICLTYVTLVSTGKPRFLRDCPKNWKRMKNSRINHRLLHWQTNLKFQTQVNHSNHPHPPSNALTHNSLSRWSVYVTDFRYSSILPSDVEVDLLCYLFTRIVRVLQASVTLEREPTTSRVRVVPHPPQARRGNGRHFNAKNAA